MRFEMDSRLKEEEREKSAFDNAFFFGTILFYLKNLTWSLYALKDSTRIMSNSDHY